MGAVAVAVAVSVSMVDLPGAGASVCLSVVVAPAFDSPVGSDGAVVG